MQLLVIDGGNGMSGWLADRLAHWGFIPQVVATVEHALRSGHLPRTTAFVLDTGHPSAHEANAIRRLRNAGGKQPLIVLSGHGDWRDKITCLDAGADDFLTKPVRAEEVAARLRAIIRRSAGTATDRFSVGDLDVDLKARCAWRSRKCLDLTRNEFRLLRLFLTNPDQVLEHQAIRDLLYASHDSVSHNAVEVQIARLRRKVGKHRIRTIRGLGYRFDMRAVGDPIPRSGKADDPCLWCPHGAAQAEGVLPGPIHRSAN